MSATLIVRLRDPKAAPYMNQVLRTMGITEFEFFGWDIAARDFEDYQEDTRWYIERGFSRGITSLKHFNNSYNKYIAPREFGKAYIEYGHERLHPSKGQRIAQFLMSYRNELIIGHNFNEFIHRMFDDPYATNICMRYLDLINV